MLPRVGHIQFLNSLPLYYGLVKNGVLPSIKLIKDTPTALCRKLVCGQIDTSPIPSIAYARHADELLLLPRLTISSDGKVMSILVVSTKPIEELDGQPVALTNTSATSHALAKIIFNEKYHITPCFFESPPDLPAMLMEAKAALLIGDDALRVFVEPKGLYIYDLGEEWKILSGHKMVYALWAVRKDYAQKYPDIIKNIYHAFEHSMQYSINHLEEIARDAARWELLPEDFIREYIKGLKFEFGPDYQHGYREFLARAKRLGLIEKIPVLKFLEID